QVANIFPFSAGSAPAAFLTYPFPGTRSGRAMGRNDRKSRELSDRRGAYRCAVAGSRSWGRLRSDALNLPVEVLDESVGGFAVVMQGVCKLELGSLLWLEI